ncbi:hypothetical protein FGADI_5275 [Fusarium gaditjirri]|uniref:Uncharacterized protein n=1 Tax=Fusarium gaditjirri TaxID=282569 RepID=A0A8H4WYD1_9HYPO|nr:hypothetical protein FGADI_5275 [Fusarium gaditjirri]
MKLAHGLPILALAAPIACMNLPPLPPWEAKYNVPPWEAKIPTKKEIQAREAWLAPHQEITAACQDLILECTRPGAQLEEQFNQRVLSMQEVTEKASNSIVSLEGSTIVEKCKNALGGLDAPEIACSNTLSEPEQTRLSKKLRDLRFMFSVYDYNFTKRCVKDKEMGFSPLPRVEDLRWYLKKTADAYADIDEYCESKGSAT